MSKKLLNESTVRRFMGLANLAPLSESFLDKTVNEEDEITETADATNEADEAIEEGGTAARSENKEKNAGNSRFPDRNAFAREGLDPRENLRMREEEEDDDESKGDPSKTHPGELDYEGDDADDVLGLDAEIELDDPADGQAALADQAEVVMSQLASLINQAAGAEVVTVSSTADAETAELDMDAEVAVDDAEIADDEIDLGDLDVEDDEIEDLEEDKAYTAKKEKPGQDKRKGAEKRGGEGTLAKTKGHGKVDYVDEDKDYTAKKEKPGQDKRKGAEKRGAEGTLAKTKGHGKVDYANESKKSRAVDRLVAEITSKVISRLNK